MTTKPHDTENQPKGDDRNIIAVDTSYEGASFEDKLFLFWHEYKTVIVGLAAVAILALAGWGIITFVQQRQEARIAAEFQEAVAISEIRAFAERHSPHPLAGVAYLDVADYHFANREYDEAARYYSLAASGLGDSPPAGRARIGHGVSLALTGQSAEALTQFEQIGRNPENFDIIRAEAYYHAATLAVETGQAEAARGYIERVMEIDQSQVWASRAMSLQQTLPQVADEPAAPAEVSDAS